MPRIYLETFDYGLVSIRQVIEYNERERIRIQINLAYLKKKDGKASFTAQYYECLYDGQVIAYVIVRHTNSRRGGFPFGLFAVYITRFTWVSNAPMYKTLRRLAYTTDWKNPLDNFRAQVSVLLCQDLLVSGYGSEKRIPHIVLDYVLIKRNEKNKPSENPVRAINITMMAGFHFLDAMSKSTGVRFFYPLDARFEDLNRTKITTEELKHRIRSAGFSLDKLDCYDNNNLSLERRDALAHVFESISGGTIMSLSVGAILWPLITKYAVDGLFTPDYPTLRATTGLNTAELSNTLLAFRKRGFLETVQPGGPGKSGTYRIIPGKVPTFYQERSGQSKVVNEPTMPEVASTFIVSEGAALLRKIKHLKEQLDGATQSYIRQQAAAAQKQVSFLLR